MSLSFPECLPELINTNGSWNEIRTRLYEVFKADFKCGRPQWNGVPIWWDRRCLDGDLHEEGFWHLITSKDKRTGERLLESSRAQRLRWCRFVINNSGEPAILVFDYVEGNGKIRTYLWGHQFDYVVIVEKVIRKERLLANSLVTAFPLSGPSRRRGMQKKYDNRVS
jgi:hypothetical protein